MIIYLTRHGQTRLNKMHLMQGRTDEPLNDAGREQARQMRSILEKAHPGLAFDAVYASPLDRAVETGSIIGDVPRSRIITDERLLEADFGRFEQYPYHRMGIRMTLYWRFPEFFKAPDTVETVESMKERSHSFLKELEKKDYKTVLVACHGGILRPLCGYLLDKRNGLYWRPKPKNCEVRVFESTGGAHHFLERFVLPK